MIFSVKQTFREINLSDFRRTKTAILNILAAMNFEFLEIFDIFKWEIFQKLEFKASKMTKMAVFDLLISGKLFLAALNFAFFGIFDIFKCEIPQKSKSKASKMEVFDH